MKKWMPISLMLLALSAVSYGQATPTAVLTNTSKSTRWGLPALDGTVHYALSASQMVELGYYAAGDVTHSTALSGNVSYSNASQSLPFSMLFSGGVLLGSSGQGTTTFQNISVSQGLVRGKWVLGVSNSFSLLPQSATTGLSGVPGVGDLGTQPVESPTQGPAGGVLTYSGYRIANSLAGNVERRLTGRTSIVGMGGWSILRFLDNNGLDTSDTIGTLGVNHRIDARNTIGANVAYSTYETSGNIQNASQSNPLYATNFQTRGVNGQYSRLVSRSLSFHATVGPQWINSSSGSLIPSRLNVAADVGLNYSRKLTGANFDYGRGVNSGSGVQAGGLYDTFSGGISHNLSRTWTTSVQAVYSRTSGLLQAPPASGGTTPADIHGYTKTFYCGAQLTHGFSRSWSGWISYAAQHQAINELVVSQNAFSGFSQTFGIGITFAPRATRLGQF